MRAGRAHRRHGHGAGDVEHVELLGAGTPGDGCDPLAVGTHLILIRTRCRRHRHRAVRKHDVHLRSGVRGLHERQIGRARCGAVLAPIGNGGSVAGDRKSAQAHIALRSRRRRGQFRHEVGQIDFRCPLARWVACESDAKRISADEHGDIGHRVSSARVRDAEGKARHALKSRGQARDGHRAVLIDAGLTHGRLCLDRERQRIPIGILRAGEHIDAVERGAIGAQHVVGGDRGMIDGDRDAHRCGARTAIGVGGRDREGIPAGVVGRGLIDEGTARCEARDGPVSGHSRLRESDRAARCVGGGHRSLQRDVFVGLESERAEGGRWHRRTRT